MFKRLVKAARATVACFKHGSQEAVQQEYQQDPAEQTGNVRA